MEAEQLVAGVEAAYALREAVGYDEQERWAGLCVIDMQAARDAGYNIHVEGPSSDVTIGDVVRSEIENHWNVVVEPILTDAAAAYWNDEGKPSVREMAEVMGIDVWPGVK